jgi:hypothetical protein
MDLTFTAKTLSNSSSVTCAVGCIIVNFSTHFGFLIFWISESSGIDMIYLVPVASTSIVD